MRNDVLIAILSAALAFGGCKKKPEEPAAPGPSGSAVEPTSAPADATPAEPAVPEFEAGELVVAAPLGELGVTASYPKNLALKVEGTKAELTADGFYPVTVAVEPLTLENAVMKVSVNGVDQLTFGSTYDGQAKVYQTSCLLVRCLVDHPNPYLGNVADVGRAICDSLAEIPPPTEGRLRQLRDGSYSFGGPCSDEDRARQAPFQEAVGKPEVKDAVERCWREAAAVHEAWRSVESEVRVGWRLSDDADPVWKVEIDDDLEGDAAAFTECTERALEPALAMLPGDVRTTADCVASFTAVYDLDHRPVCPGAPPAEPAAAPAE
ncbi:MAG: hypothetical protein JXB32_06985 [Deltaproteobacteria bacterium]|nr:hypothetical protein [Deltaproteobacteria bacterium]